MLTVFGVLLSLVSFHAADVFGLSSSSVGGMLLGVTMTGLGLFFGKR